MTSKTKGKDLEAFRAVHDKSYLVPKRIVAGLAELGESWEYEAEFIRRCQLSTTDFATYREPFLEHSVDTASMNGLRGKRVWCGTKKFAAQLREKIA